LINKTKPNETYHYNAEIIFFIFTSKCINSFNVGGGDELHNVVFIINDMNHLEETNLRFFELITDGSNDDKIKLYLNKVTKSFKNTYNIIRFMKLKLQIKLNYDE
jgi:hypothetical protein